MGDGERCAPSRQSLGAERRSFPHPPSPIPYPLLFLAIALSLSAHAEIIDRIAISVGDRVITTSDLDREIRVTAFLNGVKPDFSPAGKRATAERMVEQKLVRRELESSRYPTPQPNDVLPALDEFKKRFYPNQGDFEHALAQYGITEQNVKDELLWQRTLLEFIEVRFRSGVQVTDRQIQDYFDKVVAPAARAAHPGQPVSLADYRDQIELTLTGRGEDREMDSWLKEARRRTEIVYHEEALQ
jgi:peptidyl-prolyl cis-trans isomerase SurA